MQNKMAKDMQKSSFRTPKIAFRRSYNREIVFIKII